MWISETGQKNKSMSDSTSHRQCETASETQLTRGPQALLTTPCASWTSRSRRACQRRCRGAGREQQNLEGFLNTWYQLVREAVDQPHKIPFIESKPY